MTFIQFVTYLLTYVGLAETHEVKLRRESRSTFMEVHLLSLRDEARSSCEEASTTGRVDIASRLFWMMYDELEDFMDEKMGLSGRCFWSFVSIVNSGDLTTTCFWMGGLVFELLLTSLRDVIL